MGLQRVPQRLQHLEGSVQQELVEEVHHLLAQAVASVQDGLLLLPAPLRPDPCTFKSGPQRPELS